MLPSRRFPADSYCAGDKTGGAVKLAGSAKAAGAALGPAVAALPSRLILCRRQNRRCGKAGGLGQGSGCRPWSASRGASAGTNVVELRSRWRARNSAIRSSGNSPPISLLATPSTPNPTGAPAVVKSTTQAMPDPSRQLSGRRPASARPAVGGGSAGVRTARLLTAGEDELTADALAAHRKLVGAYSLEESLVS